MKSFLSSLVLAMFIFSCNEPTQEETKIPQPKLPSFCTYDLDGICVIVESNSIDIDTEMLSWSLSITEDYVNLFYPGLDLASLSEQEGLKLYYSWANATTKYQGTYDNYKVVANVYLRDTAATTQRMECSDRYYIAMHEILHFIVTRHIGYDYEIDSTHMAPHIFKLWEMQQSVNESRSYDYTNIAEGLIYYDISNKCGYD